MAKRKPTAAAEELRESLKPKPGQALMTYGCPTPPDQVPIANKQFFYDSYAFAWRVPIDNGAPPRTELFKRMTRVICPEWFEWHSWTERTVDACCNNMWIGMAGCSSAGKAQPLGSIVWTPTGPKLMADIRVGDRVCDAHGGVSLVQGVFPQGNMDIYEVVFSDGARVRCTDDHLWQVGDSASCYKGRLQVMTLREMRERLPVLKRNHRKFIVPKPKPVHMESSKVPMDPYLLGVLLGDGAFSNSNLCFSTADSEILESVRRRVSAPYEVRHLGRYDYCITVPGRRQAALRGLGRVTNAYKDALKELGLWGLRSHEKFVPDCYLYNDIETRLWLLRGLMDTDGSCSARRSSVVFTSTSRRLAEAVRLLVESLGGACRIAEQDKYYTYKGERKLGKRSYNCTIEHDDPAMLFHLSRKKRQKPRERSLGFRRIEDILLVGKELAQCIKVSSADHLYLTDHFVVTHNTHNAVGFACTWWMANPQESSVILCSTTAKAMRKRAWAEVQKFHTSIPGPRCGHFVDSQMLWKANPKDDRHAIMGIAVEEGGTAKVADNIKGVHTKRQLVMIDEGTAVSPAIFDACTNLFSYPAGYPNGEFILMILGNPRTRLDEFGKFCEPLKGWNTVTVEDEEWETKPQINGRSGIVIRFDAEKSPNITSGTIVSKHLPTKATVEEWRNKAGSQDDPRYWSNQRGFFPPEGLVKSVFTESALIANDAFGKLHFTGRNFRIIAAFDPARTGDHPTLRFGALGEIEGGLWGLEAMDPIVIPVRANSNNPIDFQLLEQVRREFEQVKYRGTIYSCAPEHFGVDATGGGADLCDIFQRHWSPKIMRVLFGGAASQEQVNHEDVRLACDVYRTKRAEMYFRARHMSDAKQLKGIDKETGKELCTILFDDSKPLITLVPKEEYRKQFGKSPDDSDSLVILCEVARRLGFRLAAHGKTVDVRKSMSLLVKKAQAVYAPEDSHVEEEFEYT